MAIPMGRREIARSRQRPSRLVTAALGLAGVAAACGGTQPPASSSKVEPHPSILLVTLDTTRADAIGPDAAGVETPAFNALVARGRRFIQAYATVPETLPSHASILTGLYPAGHLVHENGRFLDQAVPLLAERLKQIGYRTGAFVSSFSLSRRFGLARGFDVYDDEQPVAGLERTARDTTDRAIAFLAHGGDAPLLLWVHYFEPHAPYEPPEPFRSRYAAMPYLGEVAAMDEELGRLVKAFEGRSAGPTAMAVVGDHGEGLGDHGELQHGVLLYQSTMHVPLVLVGPGMPAEVVDEPVSTRRVFHTLADWAGLGSDLSLRGAAEPVVLGEAMKPFLEYGWQPQVMGVVGTKKAIVAGRTEVYDVLADPAERGDLGSATALPAALRTALDDYPVPSPESARAPEALTPEARQKLASLGYVSSTAVPAVRRDAPRPVDMAHLFDVIEQASTLFVQGQYARALPLLERILRQDRYNLDAALRLATAHSMLGRDTEARAAFQRAAEIAPRSPDVRVYLALHYARGRDWPQAEPMLEQVLAEMPERLPALEALASIRERQGRTAEAVDLWLRVYALRAAGPADLVRVGELAMEAGRTDVAISSFERARITQGSSFRHDLELGVLYLAARRFVDAREALDRVPASHPAYPMALFKRAQVSVLLNEPDRARRIALARERADATTRALIARERLFIGVK
ncbi:MAG: sulfatase-like hydrolase/transferase [Acidobacteriota bacterium]